MATHSSQRLTGRYLMVAALLGLLLGLSGCDAPGDEYIRATVRSSGRQIEGFVVSRSGGKMTVETRPNFRVAFPAGDLEIVERHEATPWWMVRWRLTTWWQGVRRTKNEKGQILIAPERQGQEGAEGGP